MSTKWGEDTTVKFVELYRQHESLWNSRLSAYKNRVSRSLAIRSIVDAMGIEGFNVAEAKTKIKNLRSTYAQELTKIKKSQESGLRADEICRPKMRWFPIMHSFIQAVNKRRDTLSEMVIKETFDDYEPQEPLFSPQDLNNSSDEETQSVSVDIKRQRLSTDKATEIYTSIKKLKSLETSEIEPTEEDEFKIFGQSVAVQLKKLPLALAISAQGEIQRILTRYRLANISNVEVSRDDSRSSLYEETYDSVFINGGESPSYE